MTLGSGSRLRVEVGARGRLHAIEVRRTARCSGAADCPRLFQCAAGVCAPVAMTEPGFDASALPDVSAVVDVDVGDLGDVGDVGGPRDAGAMDAGRSDAGRSDAGRVATLDQPGYDAGSVPGTLPGCTCRVGSASARVFDPRWLVLLALAYRRRRAA